MSEAGVDAVPDGAENITHVNGKDVQEKLLTNLSCVAVLIAIGFYFINVAKDGEVDALFIFGAWVITITSFITALFFSIFAAHYAADHPIVGKLAKSNSSANYCRIAIYFSCSAVSALAFFKVGHLHDWISYASGLIFVISFPLFALDIIEITLPYLFRKDTLFYILSILAFWGVVGSFVYEFSRKDEDGIIKLGETKLCIVKGESDFSDMSKDNSIVIHVCK